LGLNKTIPNPEPIPKGRLTEVGVLSMKYNLREMPTKSYPKRTKKNVFDSDGTVIFTHGSLAAGSLLTQEKANQYGKPTIHLDRSYMECGRARSCSQAGVNPVPEGRPTTG